MDLFAVIINLITVAIVIALLYWLTKRLAGFAKRKTQPVDPDHPYAIHQDAIHERWAAIKAEIAQHGTPLSVPMWWADESSERQIERLKKEGVYIETTLTKGQCSDLIGLFVKPQKDDLKVLKFFGAQPSGPTQFEIREQIRHIFTDPDNRDKWDEAQ